jgi:hypothetical protein
MIDYLSANIVGIPLADWISKFDFTDRINLQTGEIIIDKYGVITKTANIGEFELQIRITSQNHCKVYLKGSLHKYYTGSYITEGYNHSDFSYSNICEAIYQISQVMNVTPSQIILHQLEFGLNIHTKENPSFVIEQILSHKGMSFEQRDFLGKGKLIRVNRERYSVKIYNKGLQYDLPNHILRVEIKVNKMAYFQGVTFKDYKISTMSDLLNFTLYESFLSALISTLRELIFTDDRISIKEISNEKERSFFKDASNTRYWSKQRNLSDSKTFNRKMRKLDDIRLRYAPDDLKGHLQESLQNKFADIIKNVAFSPMYQHNTMSNFHTHIVSESNSSKRLCVTCGRDISNQKSNSWFCSELRYGNEVKRCRNKVSNLKVRENRYYPQQTLFDVDSYLTPELQRLKSIAFKTLIYHS